MDGECRPCERGFYKSESSQITCDTCPLGYTTLAAGATHIGMCSYGRYNRTLVKSVCVTEKCFSYFSTKTYVVGTQKNCLNETVLLSTQNIC